MEILNNIITIINDNYLKIRNEIDNINDKYLINLVLSKLDFIPLNYKIIRNDNKIIIKCHNINKYNFVNETNKLYNIIKNDNEGYYIDICNNKKYICKLPNYLIKFNIKIVDILIDLSNKNYKIIICDFEIIKCIYDIDNLYYKIINYLNDKSFYININGIYDENYNLNENIYADNYNQSYYKIFNIEITDDNEKITIEPAISYTYIDNDKKNMEAIMHINNNIDTKPFINNLIKINKIAGGFI